MGKSTTGRGSGGAHQQVMSPPSRSVHTKIGVTPPAKPSGGSKTGGGTQPGSTPNSPGIKGK